MTRTLSRRDLLKITGLSAAAAITPRIANAADTPSTTSPASAGKPRNIIFLVSDGMSAGVLSLADSFSRLVRKQPTHWPTLMQQPGVAMGLVETYSLDSTVTDSAAAASAWGSGSRVENRSLNMLPDGQSLTPLATLLKTKGKRVGLVSTCTITHATPAGFAISHHHRDEEQQIAEKYLTSGVDILLGGGSQFFAANTRTDHRDLAADFTRQGYTHCADRNALMQNASSSRLLGLFTPGHLPYTLDHNQSHDMREVIPTLAEMAKVAIDNLAQSANGFFLMIEGGRVDHAAHANDAAAALWDQLAFDDALGVALDFTKDRDDTLIIVTTDHGNSNPGLNNMPASAGGSDACFQRLAGFRASYEAMRSDLKNQSQPDAAFLQQLLKQHTQLDIADKDVQALHRILQRQDIGELNQQHANLTGALGQILGNHTGIGWTGVTHTADYANLTAVGPGATLFQGFGRNVDAFAHITQLCDIDHVNPRAKQSNPWRSAQASPGPVYGLDTLIHA